MIRLHRPPAPQIFHSARIRNEILRLSTLGVAPSEQEQNRALAWARASPFIRSTFDELLRFSYGKCAYCESSIAASGGTTIDHFRPKSRAIDFSGEVSAQHYWWLMFEWTNLLPACQACNRAKANRFPVIGLRTDYLQTVQLEAERPLLLDPCLDDPDDHLIFDESGGVSFKSARGEATIEILALNRGELRRARETELVMLISQLRNLASLEQYSESEFIVQRIQQLLARHLPYLGARRQMVNLWLGELSNRSVADDLMRRLKNELGREGKFQVFISRADIEDARLSLMEKLRIRERYSVDSSSEKAKNAYYRGARRIERISISNFKGIDDLDLVVPSSRTLRESWLMLVGENAVGKSSVLQAIALALVGSEHLQQLEQHEIELIRHGQADASVEIQLTNVSQPVRLILRASEPPEVKPKKELVLLLGYGSTRLLYRSDHAKQRESTSYVRVRNLFDPTARLQHAVKWMTNTELVSADLFHQVAFSLKRLLMLPDESNIVRSRNGVHVEHEGDRNSLHEMSDGYQSVVALAVDIMIGVSVRWSSMETAEGIVLIDEIETHLHPRWKVEIVGRLRSVFPRLMFIATTHDPLCLRGLEPGEIVVMRRKNGRVTATVIEESVSHLRTDQLLTSELFGLYSTRDNSITEAIARHARLASTDLRSPEEEAEMSELEARLSHLQSAETPVERAVEKSWPTLLDQFLLPEVRSQLSGKPLPEYLNLQVRQALKSIIQPRGKEQ